MKNDAIIATAVRLNMDVDHVKKLLPIGQQLKNRLKPEGIEPDFSDEQLKALEVAITYNLFDDTFANEEIASVTG
jgi:hypothetical protein